MATLSTQLLLHNDVLAIWTSLHMLLGEATKALHPLVLNILGSVCCTRDEVWRDILQEAPLSVCQELMMSPLTSSTAVDASQAKQVLQAAPPVVKMAVLPHLSQGHPCLLRQQPRPSL